MAAKHWIAGAVGIGASLGAIAVARAAIGGGFSDADPGAGGDPPVFSDPGGTVDGPEFVIGNVNGVERCFEVATGQFVDMSKCRGDLLELQLPVAAPSGSGTLELSTVAKADSSIATDGGITASGSVFACCGG